MVEIHNLHDSMVLLVLFLIQLVCEVVEDVHHNPCQKIPEVVPIMYKQIRYIVNIYIFNKTNLIIAHIFHLRHFNRRRDDF